MLHGENSKFLSFLSWLECAQSSLPLVSGGNKPLFPCVLPYPEALSSQGVTVEELPLEMMWAKRHVNVLVAWCNYVVLGCPDCDGGTYEPRTSFRCGNDVRDFADRMLGEVAEFGSASLMSGRLAMRSSRHAVEEALRQTSRSAAGYVAGPCGANLAGALPVVASRVAIPEHAGQVDPCDLLPSDQRMVVSNLESLRKPEHLWEPVPPACHRVCAEEEAGLVRKLLQSGMVKLVPESELLRDSNGKFLSGGFFCVPKNDSEDRLIFDRRPENATMDRVIWAKLPSGACFTRMMLRPNEYVRGSGDDLRNFYYTLRLPENWVKYNSIGTTVEPRLVAEAGGPSHIPHRMCLRVLGMGDCNACDIAQATHEAVLKSAGLLTEETILRYGFPAPAGDLWDGAYLDDLLVAAKRQMDAPIPLDGSFIPPPASGEDTDMQRMQAAEQAYEKAGLERAHHKSFRAEPSFRAWGAEVNGIQGHVGAPLELRQQTWSLVQQVVQLGWCTKKILQKVMGYICFIFQFRREFYSLQHHIYKYIDRMHEQWNRLPGFICDELRSMAYHIPLAKWNMRKTFLPSVLATDATPSSGGAARASMSGALAEELWRQSEVRGEVVRLDESSLRAVLNSWNDPKEPSAFASALGKCLEWTATAGYSFGQTSHINLQETRALRREIAKLASDVKNAGTVQIGLNDSRVVVGAVAKGRSSSFKLNGVLRGMLPFLVLADITIALLWVETDSNPADHPSRGNPIPRPLKTPNWLLKYVEGRVAVGWEIFAVSGRLTEAHARLGITMLDPVDILLGTDAMDVWIDEILRSGTVQWLWLAPPNGSFSPLRNMLWQRALKLATLCYGLGIYFFLEHPRDSKAWQLRETQALWSQSGVFAVRVDWCMYGGANQKPTRILSTAPWLKSVARCCDGSHPHGPPLRGKRAKAAGAYPEGFCAELAVACKHWW